MTPSLQPPRRTTLMAAILVFEAAAQTQTEPSPLIQLFRRPGVDASSIRRYVDARAAVNVLGMTSITGPSETWLVASHDSFAGIVDVDRAVPATSLARTPDEQLTDVFAGSRN